MKSNFFLTVVWLVAAVPVLLTGCSPSSSSPSTSQDSPTIKIGEFASLTGSEATFGQSSHQGTQLAVDAINAAGGVLGKPLELITEDDLSQAGQPAVAVRKLIASDSVVAVLGEVASSRSLEAAPICQEYKVPMISPASTNPRVTQVGDYIFRVCFIDPFQGTVMADFALNTLHLKSVAVLSDVRSDYSLGLARFFKERFVSAGGRIVADENYSGGDKDFSAQLTSIKAANPDGVFVPGYYTEVGLIALQSRQLGLSVPMFGGDGWESSSLVPIGGQALEGDYFSTHFSPDDSSPMVQSFVKAYTQRYGQIPDAMAALGYDSAFLLADAIKRAGGAEGSKLRDALAATTNFPGVTGSITMDSHRDASKPAVILTISGGHFKYVKTIAP